MTDIIDDLASDLKKDESLRCTIYDDATGKRIVPRSQLLGHPTIGYGRALDTHGITEKEALYLLYNDCNEVVAWCKTTLSFFDSLDEIRQRAIANMAFQMGGANLIQFKHMLTAIQLSKWREAYDAGKDSLWYKETPMRAEKVLQMILTGNAP